uniref:Retrotransposon gag domain-containing protein n=1 Tax=Ananas comosus var. bracteatus TaxID=296719 RepID=A0A6V7PXB9_ANACO|nr:unnamed protein product [Ananas comosus var. bracteatus]
MRRLQNEKAGHPYPIEYDSILFPDGYIVPKFRTFYGIGNPDQHLAYFRATCGNTGGNSALLLRQFPQSLSGVAFEWYYSLDDESITTWDDMEEAFRTKFATISDKITIAGLVATKRRKDESMLEYITRWRNLSIRCEQPIEQTQTVGLLMGNVHNWMAPFLCTTKCTTFQDLILNVSILERTDPHALMNLQTQKPKQKEGKRVEVKTEHFKATHTNVVEKRKKAMTTIAEQASLKSVLRGNNFKGLTFEERKNKIYLFKKDKVKKIFRDAIKCGLQLPKPRN